MLSQKNKLDLYELLPVLYRLQDASQGYALRAILELISDQADIVKKSIDGLWDDFFIETCDEWVIPYIGDLVGNNPLHEVVTGRRADVAKTIYYRRRKGTLPMLEELAGDITGWDAHAVAFFELLSWTQNLNHQRYSMAPNPEKRYPNAVEGIGTVNLRSIDALDRLNGPFDSNSYRVDVRKVSQSEGWYNISNIGVFLWRLKRYQLSGIMARQSANHKYGYHFSPLGNPAPLFNKPVPGSNEAGQAGEINVSGPIRPAAFYFDLMEYESNYKKSGPKNSPPASNYYGPKRSLEIKKDGKFVPPNIVMCKNLKKWDRPPKGKVAVDVHRGRLTFAENEEPVKEVEVAYSYGFSNDIGGGPYDRSSTLTDIDGQTWQISVAKGTKTDTLQKAVKAWNDAGKPNGIIEIKDNDIYGGQIMVDPPDDRRLVIQAGNHCRPVLRNLPNVHNLIVKGKHPDARIHLNGLLIEGRGVHIKGQLGLLEIIHCTLVPGGKLTEDGKPAQSANISLTAEAPNERLQIVIAFSIAGALRLPAEMTSLTIKDSILDAIGKTALAQINSNDKYGPVTNLERTTVFGQVFARKLTLVSETIITGPVKAQRRQTGCIRYSYLPDDKSLTPRRYWCQPDMALEAKAKELNKNSVDKLSQSEKALVRCSLQPAFTAVRYGKPGYAQLSLNCPEEICTGAEDGSEMGVFSSLKQPQRQTNLKIRLEEYLPFGLEAGLIYVT